MKPYPKYKNSGVEWIGDVPEHWRVEKLKWIAKVRLSNIDKKSKEGELAVELCNYVDVYYNDNITSDIEFMKATARQDQIDIFSLKRGDVLITKDSETPDDIAVPAFVSSSLHGVVCGYHLAHVRHYRKYADGNYLFRSFSAYGISDQFEISANGVTRFGIGKQAIDNSIFLTPPLGEQTDIAAYLDRKTTQIDNLISKKQKLIELLKEKRSAIINQAVTKGLNPDAPMKDSGIEWIGEIPEHWEVIRMRYVFNLLSGNGFPDHYQGKTEGDYPFYKVSDINLNGIKVSFANNYVTRANVVENGWTIIPEKSILLAKIGEALKKNHRKINVSECLIDNNMLALVKRNNYYNTNYLYYLMLLIDMVWFINPGAIPSINLNKLRNIFVGIPEKSEQAAIAVYLDRKTTEIDQTISKIEKQIGLLKEFRTALISEAVTGKIDVRDGGSNG